MGIFPEELDTFDSWDEEPSSKLSKYLSVMIKRERIKKEEKEREKKRKRKDWKSKQGWKKTRR